MAARKAFCAMPVAPPETAQEFLQELIQSAWDSNPGKGQLRTSITDNINNALLFLLTPIDNKEADTAANAIKARELVAAHKAYNSDVKEFGYKAANKLLKEHTKVEADCDGKALARSALGKQWQKEFQEADDKRTKRSSNFSNYKRGYKGRGRGRGRGFNNYPSNNYYDNNYNNDYYYDQNSNNQQAPAAGNNWSASSNTRSRGRGGGFQGVQPGGPRGGRHA